MVHCRYIYIYIYTYLIDLSLLSRHSLDRILYQLLLLLLGVLLRNGCQVVVTHIIPSLIVIPRTIQTLHIYIQRPVHERRYKMETRKKWKMKNAYITCNNYVYIEKSSIHAAYNM